MRKESLNLYFVVVGEAGSKLLSYKQKGKRLKSYNNYLLWILLWVGFHLRPEKKYIGMFARL